MKYESRMRKWIMAFTFVELKLVSLEYNSNKNVSYRRQFRQYHDATIGPCSRISVGHPARDLAAVILYQDQS